jgi:hypothetical protein
MLGGRLAGASLIHVCPLHCRATYDSDPATWLEGLEARMVRARWHSVREIGSNPAVSSNGSIDRWMGADCMGAERQWLSPRNSGAVGVMGDRAKQRVVLNSFDRAVALGGNTKCDQDSLWMRHFAEGLVLYCGFFAC